MIDKEAKIGHQIKSTNEGKDVSKRINNIKGTSAGPDLIRYEMLKNLKQEDKITLLKLKQVKFQNDNFSH